VDAAALSGELWTGKASSRLRVDAVAAYFADILRTYDTGEEQLPDPLSLAQLSRHAHELAKLTEDSAVTGLATAIDQARELRA
jgi:Ca-activated chloride channel family protein